MIQEFAFRVKTLDNPLMRFTAENGEHRILIGLLRGSARENEERAVFTFIGPNQDTKRFLTGEFAKRYGSYEPIHEAQGYVSVEVSTHLLPEIYGKTPSEVTYEILGPDAQFLPLLVTEGWLHVRVLSAHEAAGERYLRFLHRMKEHLRPDAFHLYPVREYRPEARLHEAVEDITARQLEVLNVAYDMGYWAEPRRCNLEDIANRLGVSKAAVHKSLRAAERKVMATFFEDVLKGTIPGARSHKAAAATNAANAHSRPGERHPTEAELRAGSSY